MADIPIYLGYPNRVQHPMLHEWLPDIRGTIENDASWRDWNLKEYEYDLSCALRINDAVSAIKANSGPSVLLRPVQQRVFEDLRRKLSGRSIVLIGKADNAADILALMEESRDKHLTGEPMLPQKFIVSLLLIAKLEKHQMWGGKNKGYMWASDLAKGRGLDEMFASRVSDVILDLGLQDFLIRKTSNRKPKYGLNPNMRNEIYEALRTREFPEEIQSRLMADAQLDSARALDLLNDEDYTVVR